MDARQTNATLSKELAACARLGWRDFPRLDRSDVGRAHVAIHCPVFALAQTRHFGGDACVDSLHPSEVCARGRVRCSGATFTSRGDLDEEFQAVDTNSLYERLGRVSVCGCHGRISPNVRRVPWRFGQGYRDRQWWRNSRVASRFDIYDESFNQVRKSTCGPIGVQSFLHVHSWPEIRPTSGRGGI